MDTAHFPEIDSRHANDIWLTIRRHFVDSFFEAPARSLAPGSDILDLGGEVSRKRGYFDIRDYPVNVVSANYSRKKKPQVQCDACVLPFRKEAFDVVICSELLEHLYDPRPAILEACRVLKKTGVLMICVPFSVRKHGDPDDYGRYTDSFWRRFLSDAGFKLIKIEKQGSFWCVLTDMLRDLIITELDRHPSPIWTRAAQRFMGLARKKAIQWDNGPLVRKSPTLSGFTTGFGITARKK